MATKTASGKLTRTITNIVLIGLLIVATAGVTLFFQDKIPFSFGNAASGDATAPAQPRPTVLPDPLFISLEPFTVSLRDNDGSRVLYVGVTLRVDDEASRKMLQTYMPEVRDRVLRTLTQLGTRQVQAADGREVLAEQLQAHLSQPFHPNPHGPAISRVLFTAYVVQ